MQQNPPILCLLWCSECSISIVHTCSHIAAYKRGGWLCLLSAYVCCCGVITKRLITLLQKDTHTRTTGSKVDVIASWMLMHHANSATLQTNPALLPHELTWASPDLLHFAPVWICGFACVCLGIQACRCVCRCMLADDITLHTVAGPCGRGCVLTRSFRAAHLQLSHLVTETKVHYRSVSRPPWLTHLDLACLPTYVLMWCLTWIRWNLFKVKPEAL